MAVLGMASEVEGFFEGGESPAGATEEDGSGIGERDADGVTLEEDEAGFLLEVLDLFAEGRACDAEAVGGFAEVQFFGDCDEVSEVP